MTNKHLVVNEYFVAYVYKKITKIIISKTIYGYKIIAFKINSQSISLYKNECTVFQNVLNSDKQHCLL